MTKLVAPPEIGHFDIENVEYHRDEDGTFTVQLAAHEAAMRRLGAVTFVPGLPVDELFAPSVERVQSDFDAELAAKDAEIARGNEERASLLARLEALEKAAAAAPAPATPPAPEKASGDTFEGKGGTADDDQSDKLAAALALKPDFDAMKRDDMVVWLEGVGIVVPASISTANARKAIDDAVADYEKDHASDKGE